MARFRTRSDQLDAGPAFFLPFDGGGVGAQRAEYARLRESAGSEADRSPHPREIYSIECRMHGRDCTVEVGAPLPGGAEVVAAIFDVGGDDRYLVYGVGSSRQPITWLRKKSVYEVLEFSDGGSGGC